MIPHFAAVLLAVTPLAPQLQDAPVPVSVRDQASMDPEIAALIADYLARAQADPSKGSVHADLGLVYEANTLFAAAAKSYTNAINLLPDAPQWVYRRAVVLQASGDAEQALADMRLAASKLKNTPVIQARLGSMLLAMGDLEGADAAFQQAIAAEANQPQPTEWPQSRVGLCQIRIAQDRWIEASDVLERIVIDNPSYRHARFLLGQCYMELGREAEATAHLQAGVNAWPEFPPDPHQPLLSNFSVGFHRRMMGIENMMMGGEIGPATDALNAILLTNPTNHAVLHLLGRAHLMTGKVALGIETLRKAEAAKPDSVDIKIELATALMNKLSIAAQTLTPEESEAIMAEVMAKAQEAVSIAPNLGRPHYFLGLAINMTLDPSNLDPQAANSALQSFSTALQLGCTEPQLFERLASLYAQTGRKTEMLRFAMANAERNTGNPNAFLFLSRAQFTVGNPTQGVAAAKRAFDLAPRTPQVAMFYTQTLVSTNQMDEAMRIADFMTKAMPANAEVQTFCQNVRSVVRTGKLPGQGEQAPAPQTPKESPGDDHSGHDHSSTDNEAGKGGDE